MNHKNMNHKNTIATLALAAALSLPAFVAQAFEDDQYPNLKGQWTRVVGPNEVKGAIPFDPSKPPGLGQQATAWGLVRRTWGQAGRPLLIDEALERVLPSSERDT